MNHIFDFVESGNFGIANPENADQDVVINGIGKPVRPKKIDN